MSGHGFLDAVLYGQDHTDVAGPADDCPFHGPGCEADPREGQDFDFSTSEDSTEPT